MIIKLPKANVDEPRVPLHKVIGGEPSSASPYGSTSYKRMRLCPYEAGMHKIGLRPQVHSDALDTGLVYHHGLELYYAARKAGVDATTAESETLRALESLANDPGWKEIYDVVEKLLVGYWNAYRDDPWKVVAVEETLVYEEALKPAVQLRDRQGDLVEQTHFKYSARLDLIVEVDGWLWIVEHKTTRAITEDLITGYQLDMQVLGQVWLFDKCVDASALPPFKGVIVNIATKQKVPRYERVEVCPSRYHLAAFEESLRQWSFLEKVYEYVGYPRALGSCAGAPRGYTRCAFFDLCQSRPEYGVEDWAKEAEAPLGFVREESK